MINPLILFKTMDTLSLKGIVAAGGSVIISANDSDTLSMKAIAAGAKATGANLIIKDAEGLGSLSCKAIAACNPGHVYFDFT